MASVFKAKDRKGKSYKAWRFKFKNLDGEWTYGIGWEDKGKTQSHANKLEADHRAARVAEPNSYERLKNTPIDEVIAAYMAWGRAQGGRDGRPWPKSNANMRESYLKTWKEELTLCTLKDVSLSRVELVVQRLLKSKSAPKSVAHRVEAIRCLCIWGARRSYLIDNPLRGMAKINTRPKTPHRSLTEEEIANLLKVSPAHRRLWYEVALETGFRAAELRAIRVSNFDPSGPSVTLSADFTKNRKDASQPITQELAVKLQALANGRDGSEPLLKIPHKSESSEHIVKDFVKAGIALKTDEGKATWHSLRKVFVNNVVRSGADVKTVMELARHSSATMSLDVYASKKPALLRSTVETATKRMRDTLEKVTSAAEACCTGVAQTISQSAENLASVVDEKVSEISKLAPRPGFEPGTL